MRAGLRRFGFGLSTLFGVKRRGFFIPYRYADRILGRDERSRYVELEPIFAAAEPTFLSVLGRATDHAAALTAIGKAPPPEPRWKQDWFPRLDAMAAYVLVREAHPRKIVEVGSGHSTRFMSRAVRDSKLATEIVAIDPAPRAAIDGLGVTLIKETVQAAGITVFSTLAAGDMLFIDSSHILMPGTDVDFLFNRVLPMLPRGVWVHIHDVFLPDDYPADWEWRGYNEQLAVAALIQNRGFTIIWASHYVGARMADTVRGSAAGRIPLVAGARESSLWMVKG
jgi:hypothetical protein